MPVSRVPLEAPTGWGQVATRVCKCCGQPGFKVTAHLLSAPLLAKQSLNYVLASTGSIEAPSVAGSAFSAPVEKSGPDFHRLAVPTRSKSPIRSVPKSGSGDVTLDWHRLDSCMSRVSVTCTELVGSSRSNLLPGGNSNKGLWMPQVPMSTDEVILAVSRIAEPGSGTLPRFHQAPGTGDSSIKRTYQPKKRYRRRVHGFLRRMSTKGGARLVSNRRRKGRHRLTP